ncbi:hypothetical protein M3172_13425 [Mesobacillus subterraneus]|uniref:hypothetical protein n=1 Tax=Mesobacillus subterraneus TaxID=285983 RepID=UPI00203AFCED|nr:hypothetical protein [Mesobacillus subterraneus]MCM3574191.1 hypothetical protein [Mesobacillus subterraneus]
MAVRKVLSFEDQEKFDDIWIPSWLEQGYELESFIIKDLERFIFYNSKGDYGSLELIPYSTRPDWLINSNFPFHEFIELNNSKVFEIEKLSIKIDSRGSVKSLLEIVYFITAYSFKNNLDYCISLLNPDLYEALVWRFKIPVKRLLKHGYEDLPYYPSIIDVIAVKKSVLGQKVLKQLNSSNLVKQV